MSEEEPLSRLKFSWNFQIVMNGTNTFFWKILHLYFIPFKLVYTTITVIKLSYSTCYSTCLYFSSSDPNVMSVSVNKDLQNISSWLRDNRLIFNITNSEYMLIGSQRRLVKFNDSHLTLAIGGESLNWVTKCKYCQSELETPCWSYSV